VQVALSKDNLKMIAYCCVPGISDTKPQLKMFDYDEEEQNFVLD